MKHSMPKFRWQAGSILVISAMVLSSLTPVMSEPAPVWWGDRSVTNTHQAQNKAVANLGQLKHLATQMYAELNTLLPDGAGYELSFAPAPITPFPAWYQEQKKTLNLGQLKAVAKPVYDRLNGISPTWVESQLHANGLTTLGTNYFQDPANGYFYPWNPETPVGENYKLANLGQLKLVFALRLRENTDTDSMFDLWEYAMINAHPESGITKIADLTDESNLDGDELTTLQEYQLGTDPFLSDTNGDGLRDDFQRELLGKWKLDGDSGTSMVLDSSLNALHGEMIAGTRISDGVSGSAMSLTSGQQIKITPEAGQLDVGENGSNFSVSFWIRLHTNHQPGWNTILQKGNTSSQRTFHLSLKPDGKKLHARLTSLTSVNEGIESSATDLVPQQWTHLSYVYDGEQLKLYMNGELDSTADVSPSVANNDPFYIGKSPWLRGVNADFDEVHIHRRALSGSEVSELVHVDADGNGLPDDWERTHFESDVVVHSYDDPDDDGLTNLEEKTKGTDPNKSDSDGDNLKDGDDADPLDKAIVWKITPESTYAVIQLGKPQGVSVDDTWGYRLGEGGHVVLSRDRSDEEWDGGSGAPGKNYFQTYVWSPSEATWSALSLSDGLRGTGAEIDSQGNVYGLGHASLGEDATWPGTKYVSLRWDKKTNGWNESIADIETDLGMSFSNDLGAWSKIPHLLLAPPLMFGQTGRFVCVPGGKNVEVEKAGIYRKGTPVTEPMVTMLAGSQDSSSLDCRIMDYKQAGEPNGWHAATWTKSTDSTEGEDLEQKYQFSKLTAENSLVDANPPTGEARWNVNSLASIHQTYRPDILSEIVLWSTRDGNFQAGMKINGTGDLIWQASTRTDASKKLGGKINARGEGLRTNQLWRNGTWHDLAKFVDATQWKNLRGLDINSQGTILALADAVGEEGAKDNLIVLLPVDVVELSPKLVDESDNEIEGSEKPEVSPKSTEMVERDPLADPPILDASQVRIAWRDMKVKIGKPFAGKKVTWSMTKQFTPLQADGTPEATPRFRGKWGTAENAAHRDRFSATETYKVGDDDYEYDSMTQMLEADTSANVTITAETTVSTDGYTAIRVNLPPIGFNKAQIKILIEGVEAEIDLIKLEVPAVIVIDPGHGGSDPGAGSISGNMTESQVALDVALKSVPHLIQALEAISQHYKIRLTREDDSYVNIAGANSSSRQGMQRFNGADLFLSIHCNSAGASARRVETNIQWGEVVWENLSSSAANQGNYNHDKDYLLGDSVNTAVATALQFYDSSTTNRGVVRNDRYNNGPGVLRDSSTSNGNNNTTTPAYAPLRSALVELEFISNEQGDALLISGNPQATPENPNTWNAPDVRERVASSISGAIVEIMNR